MQYALASHELYKKQGGKDDFLSFFKMYAPYFFRVHQDWKEIHLE